MEKITVGTNYFQFHKNPKNAVIHRPIYNNPDQFRKILVPIKVLLYGFTSKEELQSGLNKRYDSFWEVSDSEYGGEEYCVFDKEVMGKRSAVSHII